MNRTLMMVGVLLALALGSCHKARPVANEIVIGETITVPSGHLGRDMVIDVGLPTGYAMTGASYPVFITCQSQFLHVTGIAADLALKNSAPALLVASVRNYASGDFIPEKLEGHPDSGGADRFIAFFRDELIPALDSRYRTRPFRLFYSGSFGGGFAVYMFLTQPRVFNACLAATPAIDYEGGSTFIMDQLPAYLAKNDYRGRFLYLGVENERALIPLLERFADALKQTKGMAAKWEYHAFLDEDHGSIPNRVLYHGLKFVFSNWTRLPGDVAGQGAGGVRSYAAALAKTYGYDIGVSRIAITVAAGALRNQGRAEEVIDLLKLGLEYEPEAEMLWLELGRALESAGKLQEGKAALETALQKADRNASPHLGIFTDALNRIDQKLNRKP